MPDQQKLCAQSWQRWTLRALPVWLLLVALLSVQRHAFGLVNDRPERFVESLYWFGFQFVPWLLLSPLLFWSLFRQPLDRSMLRAHLPWVLGSGAALVLLHTGLQAVIKVCFYADFQQRGWVDSFLYLGLAKAHAEYLVFLAIAGLVYGARLAERRQSETRRLANLERLHAQHQLQQVRRQLAPHFLFNSLNSLCALLNEDSQAHRMALAIGDFLRRIVDDHESDGDLHSELENLRAYLAIEQVRYGERLQLRWRLDPVREDLPLP